MQDLRDLDKSLSNAKHPSGLLPHRLTEIEKLCALQLRGRNGHLPNCMCQTCRGAAFQRAVGKGDVVTTSLNASSLLAYQELMMGGTSIEQQPAAAAEAAEIYQAPPPKSYKPQADLIPEIRNFGARHGLDAALVTRLVHFLQMRGEGWYQDLLDLTMGIQRSRNPNALVGGKLALAEKNGEIPKPPCFHFRQGLCKYGARCQKSHDPAAQAELPLPEELATTPCYDFLHGTCKHGARCKYLHSRDPNDIKPKPKPPGPLDARTGYAGIPARTREDRSRSPRRRF